MPIEKKCPNCGNNFYTYESINAKTCNKNCRYEYSKKVTKKRKQKICITCEKIFIPKHSKSPGLFCSYKCRADASKKEKITRNGYIYIHLPNHPNATKQGYYSEHRHVVEKNINRSLKESEKIHHINHNPSDNRIENLMIMSKKTHSSYHISINNPSKKLEVREKIRQSKLGNTNWKNRKRNQGRFI